MNGVSRVQAAVIGGGPAGLLAAHEIAKNGYEVTLFEEHSTIGEPNHCTGLISKKGLKRLNVKPSVEFIQNEIKGCRVYSPSNKEIEFNSKRTWAYVVDRAAFDRYLAAEAEAVGVQIETENRVRELARKDKIFNILGKNLKVESQLIVDAEGAGAWLARSMGLSSNMKGVLGGVNVEVQGVNLEPHMVEIWLGNVLAPGLFAWVVPLGEGKARCGLARQGGDPIRALHAFLRKRFGKIRASNPRRGVVLTGTPAKKTHLDGFLMVGDAAGQTKPTTGGGVILGGLCAIIAGRVGVRALEAGDCSSSKLRLYERTWRSTVGKEIKSMLMTRRVLNQLSDEAINSIFTEIRRGEGEVALQDLIESGDMDMQSSLIYSTLKDHTFIRILIKSLGKLFLQDFRRLFKL